MHVEPDLAVVLLGELQDPLLAGQVGDARGRAAEIERIADRLAVDEIAHDQDDVRVLGPDGLGQRLERGGVFLVHALLVAEFQVAAGGRARDGRRPRGGGPTRCRPGPWRIR